MKAKELALYNVTTHNLKGIDLKIPHNQLVLITGVSGSGKSSLVFDTVHAEGRFRYLETLSDDLGAFIKRRERPNLNNCTGLTPTVILEQRNRKYRSRTTVGGITEIFNFIKLLYTNFSTPFCPRCKLELTPHDVEDVVSKIVQKPKGTKIIITAPLSGGLDEQTLELLRRKGFARIYSGGEYHDIYEEFNLESEGDLEVVIDRLILKPKSAQRLSGSIEQAYRLSDGRVRLRLKEEVLDFLAKRECPHCEIVLPEADLRLFSRFVEPGLCSACGGKGLVETEVCKSCQGSGYDKDVLAYRFGGKNIFQLGQLPLHKLEDFLRINCSENPRIPDSLLLPIFDRLQLLTRLDLDYLKLDRRANTLSDGELQLLQIASFMHSSLTFVTYILDEPTQGLTPKELPKLLWLLKQLKNNGNSVLIVEHNPAFLNFVDYIIELGPGAGEKGGAVIHSGSLDKLLENPDSTTATWLQKFKDFRQKGSNSNSDLKFAQTREQLEFGFSDLNYRIFKNFGLKLPFNQWTIVTGPVGSGKTTLLQEILAPLFSGDFQVEAPDCEQVFGREFFPGGMSCVDFKSTTSHPYSHIASYLGVWKYLRDLFASVSLAKIRGYKSSRFSVSKKGGRCEKCKGTGVNIIELGLLSEVELPCEKCKGTGYNSETREIMYRGYSIDRVLNFSVDRAAEFFSFSRKISRKLALLQETGLGYLRLGQKIKTLSGGEVQRLKLCRDLAKIRKNPSLYLLDEPARGLHLKDVFHLAQLFQRLVTEGHTVVTTDHSELLLPWSEQQIVLKGTPEERYKKK